MLRIALLVLALAAVVAPTAIAHPASQKISSNDFSFPTTINFCGQSSLLLQVQMCNLGDTAEWFEAQFVDTGPGYPECGVNVVPNHLRWEVTKLIQPGDCDAYNITVYRPDELDTYPVVCYWLRIGPGGSLSTWLGAKMIDNPLACVDFYEEESHLWMDPATPVTFEFDIFNHLFPEFISWQAHVIGPDGMPSQTVSVDGQAGGPVEGGAFLSEGESTRISMDLEWTNEADVSFHELVITAPMFNKGGYPLGEIASLPIGNLQMQSPGVSSTPMLSAEGDLAVSPNPFNPRTTVSFETIRAGTVRVDVLDLKGRVVRQLVEEPRPAGEHQFLWDGLTDGGQRAASGTYLMRATTPSGTRSTKATLVK